MSAFYQIQWCYDSSDSWASWSGDHWSLQVLSSLWYVFKMGALLIISVVFDLTRSHLRLACYGKSLVFCKVEVKCWLGWWCAACGVLTERPAWVSECLAIASPQTRDPHTPLTHWPASRLTSHTTLGRHTDREQCKNVGLIYIAPEILTRDLGRLGYTTPLLPGILGSLVGITYNTRPSLRVYVYMNMHILVKQDIVQVLRCFEYHHVMPRCATSERGSSTERIIRTNACIRNKCKW